MSELISELIEEKAALIAERDALKARVAELESVIRADIAHISTLADDVKALAQPVTDEDVEHAVMRVSGIDPTAIGWSSDLRRARADERYDARGARNLPRE